MNCPRKLPVLLVTVLLAARLPAQETRPAATQPGSDYARIAQQVRKDVERLRGLKFKSPVKVRYFRPADVRKQYLKYLDRQHPRAQRKHLEAFLRTVGLIGVDCNLEKSLVALMLSQIVAFYDAYTDTFGVTRKAAHGAGLGKKAIAVHELTHALDDQHFHLDKLAHSRQITQDWEFVLRSVVEGSAMIVMFRYMDEAPESEDQRTEETDAGTGPEKAKAIEKLPPYFWNLLTPYLHGAAFLYHLDEPEGAGRTLSINAAMKRPPASSEQILHPEKYWEASRRDEPVLVRDADVSRLMASLGWRVIYTDTAGEALCAMLALATDDRRPFHDRLATANLNEAGSGWGGDRFYLLAPAGRQRPRTTAPAKRKGLWITAWDTPADREEFVAAYRKHKPMPNRAVCLLGRRAAAFLYGFDRPLRKSIRKRLVSSPPAFTKAGKPWSAHSKADRPATRPTSRRPKRPTTRR